MVKYWILFYGILLSFIYFIFQTPYFLLHSVLFSFCITVDWFKVLSRLDYCCLSTDLQLFYDCRCLCRLLTVLWWLLTVICRWGYSSPVTGLQFSVNWITVSNRLVTILRRLVYRFLSISSQFSVDWFTVLRRIIYSSLSTGLLFSIDCFTVRCDWFTILCRLV